VLYSAVNTKLRRAAVALGQSAPLRLLSLPTRDRRLLAQALPLVLFVRLSLWFIPLARLHRLLTARPSETASLAPARACRLAWAVAAASRTVPRATCLTRALALQLMLRARGSRSRIHVGLARRGAGQVRGHAWLEWQGNVLIGDGDVSAFKTIVTLEA
jgi:hypothetical protein